MTLMAEKTTSTGYFSKISTEPFARKQVRGFFCVSLSCSDTQTPDTSARANRSSP
jgi:hypothetical protein